MPVWLQLLISIPLIVAILLIPFAGVLVLKMIYLVGYWRPIRRAVVWYVERLQSGIEWAGKVPEDE